ncbi:MAG: hypothetical protein R6X14_08705 [bacterium]
MTPLRKFHLILGAVLAPFLLVTGVTAVLMLAGRYDPTTFGLHSWRILQRWVGTVAAGGLVLLAVSGSILYGQMRVQQLRRWRKKRREAGRSDGRTG